LSIQESFASHASGSYQWTIFIAVFGILVVVIRSIVPFLTRKNDASDILPDVDESSDDTYSPQSEIDRFAELKGQMDREERNNVWYNSTIETTSFDIPESSLCMKNATPEQFRDLISKNLIFLCIRYTVDGIKKISRGSGIVLESNVIIMNNHGINTQSAEFEIEIINNLRVTGVSSNLQFKLSQNEIIRNSNYDCAMFKCNSLPPRRSILKYWNVSKTHISKGMYVRRNDDGTVNFEILRNCEYHCGIQIAGLLEPISAFFGKISRNTQSGDCGSCW
jgi:hypothetical protein